MELAPIPPNEKERLAAVLELKILDTKQEERFDRIIRMVTKRFKVPIATISILDADREWYKSRQGLNVQEWPRPTSFCGHIISHNYIFVIEDTLLDPRFADNPQVTGKPFIRFYAGMALWVLGSATIYVVLEYWGQPHIINRANARVKIFDHDSDYRNFETILKEAQKKYDMRILAYCLMPNHFHLVLYPKHDNDLQRFMQWVTLTHTQRWHIKNGTIGSGHLYQGRYKSFLIEGDKHLLSVIRYVERNPLRARMVTQAQNWKFNSLYYRMLKDPHKKFLSEAIQLSITKSKPYGEDNWSTKIIKKFGLEATLREKGRPQKGT
jgi:putative transposase